MQHKLFKLVVIGVMTCITLGVPQIAFAAPPVKAKQTRPVRFKMPKLPNKGAPGNRSGNASRGCETPNMALMPEVQEPLSGTMAGTVSQVWGNTVAARPTFWVAIGGPGQTQSSVQFTLQDEAGQDLYQTTLATPDNPAVVPIALPATVALVVGERYRWFIKTQAQMICPTPNGSKVKQTNAYSEGFVVRLAIDPALSAQLKSAAPREQVGLYAEAGLWFEAITMVGEMRLREPGNEGWRSDWESLLESVGLTAQGQVPIAETKPAKSLGMAK